jgi:hypothetical protein
MTHGDRRVSDTASLSAFYMNPDYSKLTLKNVLRSMCDKEMPEVDCYTTPHGIKIKESIREQMIGAGLLRGDPKGIGIAPAPGCYDLEKFFNRLFAMSLDVQEQLKDLFNQTFNSYVKSKRLGEISTGVIGKYSDSTALSSR